MTETEKVIAEEVDNSTPETRSNDLAKSLLAQNPRLKIKKLKGGGISLRNPRAPTPLLMNLLNRSK
jgi:hypothetical protein